MNPVASRAAPSAAPSGLRIALAYDARYPDQVGGAERRYHEIGMRLSERHQVDYITWAPRKQHEEEGGYRIRSLGPAPELYGADGKRTVREAMRFAVRLLPVLARGGYDVVDCSATPYVPLYASWLATRVSRTPLVVTWHEFWGDHWLSYLAHRPLVARAARQLERAGPLMGDVIVPVSHFTARRMGIADEEHERVRIVGNGVDIEAVERARPRSKADVIFVGRLIDDKRVDLLLEAMAILRREFPRIRCLVIGDGPERERLEEQRARLRLKGAVRFLGGLDEEAVFGHLKAASVMVLPSIREGFGIAVLEAQVAGAVPVVARSPWSAASELVEDGVDGLLSEPSADGLATAVASLLRDPERRALMADNARRRARSWDWAHIAELMEGVYQEALAARSVRREARTSRSPSWR